MLVSLTLFRCHIDPRIDLKEILKESLDLKEIESLKSSLPITQQYHVYK